MITCTEISFHQSKTFEVTIANNKINLNDLKITHCYDFQEESVKHYTLLRLSIKSVLSTVKILAYVMVLMTVRYKKII